MTILKSLAERSRRKKNIPAKQSQREKNIPVINSVMPVTLVAKIIMIKNDDGKRIPKKFKTGIDFEFDNGLIYYMGESKRRLCLFFI